MGLPSRKLGFRPKRELEQPENQKYESDNDHLSSTRERLDTFFEPQDEPFNEELREAIMTVAGIRASVFRAYLVVLDNPGSTISEVAAILEAGYSNARRRLKQLREKGLVSRRRTVPSSGGQEYQYHAQSLAETNQWLQREIDEWREAVNEQVQTLQVARTA